MGEVLAPVLGEAPSPQTVSRVARSLDAEVSHFHSRPLSDCYCYLILDGITLKVKGASGVRKRLVLCAYGITPQGKREIVCFRQAPAESEAQWEALLRDLYERGLQGKALALVVTDGNPGLHRALDTVYPYVPRQRCWVHKLRNVAANGPGLTRARLGGASQLPSVPSRPLAQSTYHQCYRAGFPRGPPQDQAHELFPEPRQC